MVTHAQCTRRPSLLQDWPRSAETCIRYQRAARNRLKTREWWNWSSSRCTAYISEIWRSTSPILYRLTRSAVNNWEWYYVHEMRRRTASPQHLLSTVATRRAFVRTYTFADLFEQWQHSNKPAAAGPSCGRSKSYKPSPPKWVLVPNLVAVSKTVWAYRGYKI